jgi:hypothetical protein
MLIEKTYNPKGYDCKGTYKLTPQQISSLDKIEERKEFDAYFWGEKVEWFNNNDVTDENQIAVRFNGVHFVIGPENGTFKGFGGRKCIIQFTDGPHKGKLIETTNLWHQGTIPNELKDILVDNAIFLN